MKPKPTAGALRAVRTIEAGTNPADIAEVIDRETGIRDLVELLESIIDEAGDLIESRSPELVAQAREALRRFSDDTPPQAE